MFNTLGQNSNVGKLKTLSGALDIMVRTKHAFQLIGRELVGELSQVGGGNGCFCSYVSYANCGTCK